MASREPGVADSAHREWARTVLAVLRGAPAPATALDRAAEEELAARAAGGDADAAVALALGPALAALPGRVEAALAAEGAPVILADGSRLSLDDAERLLERKEERRAHKPLRASVDDAWSSFHQFTTYRIGAEGEGRRVLEAFLADTVALRDAARGALGTLGGEAPEDPPALARALDLPDAEGTFAEGSTLALLRAARDAARPCRKVTRLRGPRAMAGAAVDDGDAATFLEPPRIARFDRHMRTLEAGAVALAAGRGLRGAETAGLAMALGLAAAPARRACGVGRATAERAARVAVAAGLLRARALAAAALLDDLDGARDALAPALGGDPGAALTATLAAPPWTPESPEARALALVRAPAWALSLRDAHDELFALSPAAWSAAAEQEPDGDADGWLRWAADHL